MTKHDDAINISNIWNLLLRKNNKNAVINTINTQDKDTAMSAYEDNHRRTRDFTRRTTPSNYI